MNASPSDTSTSGICPELIELATPLIYRFNAFRVLALPVTVSVGDARRIQARRGMRGRLGLQNDDDGHLYFPATHDAAEAHVARAIESISDPVSRFLHELFWFWPADHVGCEDDALSALRRGDTLTASSIWTAIITNSQDGIVARHNLAVLVSHHPHCSALSGM